LISHSKQSIKGQNPLHHFRRSQSATSPQHNRQVRNKSVTSWRGQKSTVSVVPRRLPNSITTTCCQQVGSKLVTFPCTDLRETCVMDFGNYRAFSSLFGRAGRSTSADVNVQLFKMKCLPVLYYGSEICPLNTRCHAVAGTTARCALYNECTNPNPATNLIPVHNLQ